MTNHEVSELLGRIAVLEDALKPFAECELDFSWQPNLGGGRIHLKSNGPPPAKHEFAKARNALRARSEIMTVRGD